MYVLIFASIGWDRFAEEVGVALRHTHEPGCGVALAHGPARLPNVGASGVRLAKHERSLG